jgi:hypothetical protein
MELLVGSKETAAVEYGPEKHASRYDPMGWVPVFRRDHAQTKKPERDDFALWRRFVLLGWCWRRRSGSRVVAAATAAIVVAEIVGIQIHVVAVIVIVGCLVEQPGVLVAVPATILRRTDVVDAGIARERTA